MNNLSKALEIFKKYNPNNESLIECDGGVLCVIIEPDDVSKEDVSALEELGFRASKGITIGDCNKFYTSQFDVRY